MAHGPEGGHAHADSHGSHSKKEAAEGKNRFDLLYFGEETVGQPLAMVEEVWDAESFITSMAGLANMFPEYLGAPFTSGGGHGGGGGHGHGGGGHGHGH